MKNLYIKALILVTIIFALGSLVYYILLNKETASASILLNQESTEKSTKENNFFFIGTQDGLYKIQNSTKKILNDEILKILPTPQGIWVLTKNNLFFSSDHENFQEKSQGIKKKIIKLVVGKKNQIIQENELLKDIAFDPYNSNNIITAGVNGVYYSTNNGNTWNYEASRSSTNGIKSVAIYSWKDQIHLLFGHPYQGIYHKVVSHKNWNIFSKGLDKQGGFRDEVSSIAIIKQKNQPPIILATQNFDPVIFKLDLTKRIFTPIYTPKKTAAVEMIESLQINSQKQLIYVNNHGVQVYNSATKTLKTLDKIQLFIQQFTQQHKTIVNSISTFYKNQNLYSISELWMLQPAPLNPYHQQASHKRGVYVQTDVLRSSKRFPALLTLLKTTQQNMIVVDMKDDFGNIRFKTSNTLLNKKGVVKNPLDLRRVLPILKKAGIYVVARIPVFKDTILYKYNHGEYAIKDSLSHNSWMGLKTTKSGRLIPTKEYWVDPYNEKVWEYNIILAQELLKYGVNEIQFDYIRFPTDGTNLKNASYPAQVEGMDKESALISFLKYAREHIQAPISIDIYGANGWMRTGARTGQDVELLSLYADVIAPMYYPSHFGNTFLNYPPYEERPYRIYQQGSYRNYYIARKKSIIRPYIQAFMLTGNDYDKHYYNEYYVERQIQGVKDSVNLGYTFWNSSTKYSILYRTTLNESN